MSDMADFYREQRDKDQAKRGNNLKKNTELVLVLAGFHEIEIKQHTDVHISLFHPKKGRFDYWPSTGKGAWIKARRPAFRISDIEQFILKEFVHKGSKRNNS